MKQDLFAGQITDAEAATRFIYAGNALFTVVSKKTGDRFTFRVRKPNGPDDKKSVMRFAQVLNGPDNTSSYLYIGYLKDSNRGEIFAGNKGRPDTAGYRALKWTVAKLAKGDMPEDLEFYHSGKCGCCGRTLTVPESIKTGLGPICAGK